VRKFTASNADGVRVKTLYCLNSWRKKSLISVLHDRVTLHIYLYIAHKFILHCKSKNKTAQLFLCKPLHGILVYIMLSYMLSLYRTEDEMFLFPHRPNDNFDKVIVFVRHVTGNDQDYLRKIPRAVVQISALL
jgi:hypothetical protein